MRVKRLICNVFLLLFLFQYCVVASPLADGESSKVSDEKVIVTADNMDNSKDRVVKSDGEAIDSSKKGKLTIAQVNKLVDDIGGAISKNPLRREYESAVFNLKHMETELRDQGLGEESIAKKLYQARRDLGVKYKDLTPLELREYIYEINIRRYKDPLGPKFEALVKRYDGDYAKIIEAAQRPNPDIDKLLGGFREWLMKKNGL